MLRVDSEQRGLDVTVRSMMAPPHRHYYSLILGSSCGSVEIGKQNKSGEKKMISKEMGLRSSAARCRCVGEAVSKVQVSGGLVRSFDSACRKNYRCTKGSDFASWLEERAQCEMAGAANDWWSRDDADPDAWFRDPKSCGSCGCFASVAVCFHLCTNVSSTITLWDAFYAIRFLSGQSPCKISGARKARHWEVFCPHFYFQ